MKYLLILLTFLVVSCDSFRPPQAREIQNYEVFEMERGVIWDYIVEFLLSKNISIDKYDKVSDFLKTNTFEIPYQTYKEYMDCGDGGYQRDFKVELTVLIQPAKQGYKVTLTTKYDCYLYYVGWTEGSDGRSNCVSTGKFEKELFDYIKNAKSK